MMLPTRNNPSLFDRIFEQMDLHPNVTYGVGAVLVIVILLRLRTKKAAVRPMLRQARGMLDQALLWWSNHDPFTIRDLLSGGVLCLGRAGSGKTSSSGATLMRNIVSHPKSAGIIHAAKPEDEEDVKRIFRRAGRLKDLIVFDPDGPYRFNFLRYVGKGDPRNVTRCLMMIGETLQRGAHGGGEDGDFWQAQCERLLETSVIALQMAAEEITAVNLHRFIMTAAMSPKEIVESNWPVKYQSKVLEKGFEANLSPRQRHDYGMAKDYWLLEFPGMADRMRSSILSYATQILYTFNVGMAKELIAGETNCSPDDILGGKWILVNCPISSFGAIGGLVNAGWKYLTEMAILKRKTGDNASFVTIWCDEAHQVVNEHDSTFIAMCRSHKGCLVFLTQSISSFYGALKGESGKHRADSLLANFSTAIVHACDPITAKWAGAKLGREIKIRYSSSSSHSQEGTVWDQLHGKSQVSSSFSEQMDAILEDGAFMVGRTGGPENGFVCDAVILKSGMPFAVSGKNFLHVTFSQRG